jgi:hypothetical protein
MAGKICFRRWEGKEPLPCRYITEPVRGEKELNADGRISESDLYNDYSKIGVSDN